VAGIRGKGDVGLEKLLPDGEVQRRANDDVNVGDGLGREAAAAASARRGQVVVDGVEVVGA